MRVCVYMGGGIGNILGTAADFQIVKIPFAQGAMRICPNEGRFLHVV